jgi:hypothetical protein
MEASGLKEAGDRSVDAQRRRAVLARLLRMGVSDGGNSASGDAAAVSDLETELSLLREENAQLKVERHRPADAGHVIERMRSLRLPAPVLPRDGEGEQESELVGAIAESLVVRKGLIEACHEVQEAMRGIRGRLGALTGDLDGGSVERPTPEPSTPVAEAAEMERTGDLGASSELVKSVA